MLWGALEDCRKRDPIQIEGHFGKDEMMAVTKISLQDNGNSAKFVFDRKMGFCLPNDEDMMIPLFLEVTGYDFEITSPYSQIFISFTIFFDMLFHDIGPVDH